MSASVTPHRHALALGELGSLAGAGALAGLCGGAAMAALAMLLSATAGASAFRPIEAVASLALGGDALRGAPAIGVLIVGLALHALVSMALGMLFAGAFAQFPLEVLVPVGLLYGLAILVLARFVVLPAADLGPAGALVAEHLAYGGSLWLILFFRQSIERSPRA